MRNAGLDRAVWSSLLLVLWLGASGLAGADPERPFWTPCRLTDVGLLACPETPVSDQVECLGPAGLACGQDQDCLVQVTNGCLWALENRGWDPGPPAKPGLDGECTIAETWRKIAESKCGPGCPGDSYPTDEGCYCVLNLDPSREIHWRPLEDDGHFGILFWPHSPFPGKIQTVHFWYDTSVPFAEIVIGLEDRSFHTISYCD